MLRLREGDTAKGVPVTSQVGRLRFEEARDDLITYHKANSRDTKKLEGRIANLTPFCARKKMTVNQRALINQYIAARLKAGAKPATVNRELAWLKHMFTLATRAGKLMTFAVAFRGRCFRRGTRAPGRPRLREPRARHDNRRTDRAVSRHAGVDQDRAGVRRPESGSPRTCALMWVLFDNGVPRGVASA